MKEMDLNWDGMLTLENFEQVADLLRQLLKGKRYTFVEVNEIYKYVPRVFTHQVLRPGDPGDPIEVYREGWDLAKIIVKDSDGVWSLSTRLKEDKIDPEFRNPYLCFHHDWVSIIHRGGIYQKLIWILVIEGDEV